jgi:hypothetical protein
MNRKIVFKRKNRNKKEEWKRRGRVRVRGCEPLAAVEFR